MNMQGVRDVPTPRQLELIRDLLDELDWDERFIRTHVGEEYGDYESLDPQMASELIGALFDAKRSWGPKP